MAVVTMNDKFRHYFGRSGRVLFLGIPALASNNWKNYETLVMVPSLWIKHQN